MWGARVGSRRGARGLAALVAVVVAVSLLGIAQAGAQQNPPVNQPGVTDSEIRVGGVGTVTGDPTGNNPGGPAFEGTQAYFDYINASKDKGVCGRKLVLSSKRDDTLGNNRQEIQGLLDDNVFAALPMTTSLFTGADLLVSNGIPTFGWLINGECGSEDVRAQGPQAERREAKPGHPGLRGERGLTPGPGDEEAGPQPPEDPAERIHPGAHRKDPRRRRGRLRVPPLLAVREQGQARRPE